jgi:acetolactate synthase I/II/III large subunit
VSRTGGQLVVESLLAEGVEFVFTVPGESFLPVLDALYDQREAIEVVTTRHESGAGFAADGYAKASGFPGVCMATRGVGSTNMAIALHTAQQDSTPLVALIGQVPTSVKYREAFQEIDLVRHFGPLVKWAIEIPSPDRIPELLQQAFRRARSGRPGPVVVALPEDVLYGSAAAAVPPPVRSSAARPSAESIERAAELLLTAERPVAIAGREVLTTSAGDLLVGVAERLALPVVGAWRRYDAFPNDHEAFVGNLSPGVPRHALAALEEADLVLVLGDRFTEFTSGRYRYPRDGTRLIHVTASDETVGEWGSPTLALASSPDLFLRDLLERIALGELPPPRLASRRAALRRHRAAWTQNTAPEEGSRPGDGRTRISRLVASLREQLPADAAIVTDVGNFSMWVPRYFTFTRPKTHFGAISGAMGYALPAAIGIALTDRSRRVVVVAGDGGFAMTMSELGSVRQQDLDILSIVLVNDMYGTIRMHQEKEYPGRPIATALVNPSFAAIAEAHGVRAASVDNNRDFDRALTDLADRPGPALVEVHLGDERISAWGDHAVRSAPGGDALEMT